MIIGFYPKLHSVLTVVKKSAIKHELGPTRLKLQMLTFEICRGGGTGEASEARASPEIRGFTREKFLASWMYERGNFSCFTGKKLVPPPLYRSICHL